MSDKKVNYENMSYEEICNQITYFLQEIEEQQRVELTSKEQEHIEMLFRLKEKKYREEGRKNNE